MTVHTFLKDDDIEDDENDDEDKTPDNSVKINMPSQPQPLEQPKLRRKPKKSRLFDFPMSANLVNNPKNISLQGGGVSIPVLLNQGFPLLCLQNQLVLKKLFTAIESDLDHKTGRLPFMSFCALV